MADFHHEYVLEKKTKSVLSKLIVSDLKLWNQAFMFGSIVFILLSIYSITQYKDLTLTILNKSLSDTAIVLIGLSMMLSGLCYFWNFADGLIIYRKHLGVTGFLYMALHGIISLFLLPQFSFPEYYFQPSNILSFSAALVSFLIFTAMALISNNYSVKKIGGKMWRKVLRFGYVGFLFAALHFALKGLPQWIMWFSQPTNLPPLSLLLFIFTFFVFTLRIALRIDQFIKNKK